jgi:hypothetical protein
MIALPGRVEYLELKDVLDAPEHQGLAKHLKLDTRFAQLVSASVDVPQWWPLYWLGSTYTAVKLSDLKITIYEKDECDIESIDHFLQGRGYCVTNLEITLAATHLEESYSTYSQFLCLKTSLIIFFVPGGSQPVPHNIISSVKHLKISASHAYEASLVSAIFRCFVFTLSVPAQTGLGSRGNAFPH